MKIRKEFYLLSSAFYYLFLSFLWFLIHTKAIIPNISDNKAEIGENKITPDSILKLIKIPKTRAIDISPSTKLAIANPSYLFSLFAVFVSFMLLSVQVLRATPNFLTQK